MAKLELPVAMFCLSALSKGPTVYPKVLDSFLPRETTPNDPKVRSISKVLDAVVYFLPVDKGTVFALSMEIGTRVRFAIAGNDQKHYGEAFGRTPVETVRFIWDQLKASSDGTTSPQFQEIVACLLERQDKRMTTRFKKRQEQCFDLSKEERKASYTAFVVLLDEARTSYSKDVTNPPCRWHDLEVKVKHELNLLQPFDLVRYINKLSEPSFHISRLLKTAENRKFRDIFELPPEVDEVDTHPAPPNPLIPPTRQDIRSFLAHCYGESAPDDRPIVSQVFDKEVDRFLSEIERCSPLKINPPHCECTLVHYHLFHPELKPIPYIAVSKSSCWNRGLFFEACGESVGQGGIRFQMQSCDADVTPLLAFPIGDATADLDAVVERKILSVVEKIVRDTLRNSVNNERMRRLFQRTAGSESDGSSPEGRNPLQRFSKRKDR